MQLFNKLWRRLAFAGLLAAGAMGFAPGLIMWQDSSARSFVLSPRTRTRHLVGNGAALPQRLAILDRRNLIRMVPNQIPYFKLQSDKTITWDKSLCLEAGGGAVSVNFCSGEAAQKFNWIPTSHGGHSIQVKDTNTCLTVTDETSELNEASVVLRDCANDGKGSWRFEDTVALPSRDDSQRRPLLSIARLLVVALMALLAPLTLGALAWRLRVKSLSVAVDRGASCLNLNEELGLSLTVPINLNPGDDASRNASVTESQLSVANKHDRKQVQLKYPPLLPKRHGVVAMKATGLRRKLSIRRWRKRKVPSSFDETSDTADDEIIEISDQKTSFGSVSRWPPMHLYTFGEAGAFGEKVVNGPSLSNGPSKLPGLRVVVQGDPIPNYLPQAFGFYQPRLVPRIYLDPPKQQDSSVARQHAADADADDEGGGDGDDDEDDAEDVDADDGEAVDSADVPKRRGFRKIIADISWPQFDLGLYMTLGGQFFTEGVGRLRPGVGALLSNEQLQDGLELLTKLNSFADSLSNGSDDGDDRREGRIAKLLESRTALQSKLVSYFDKRLTSIRRKTPLQRFSLDTFGKLFTESDARLHELDVYIAALRENLKGSRRRFGVLRPGVRRIVVQSLQAYRMAVLTKRMSYVDASVAGIDTALDIIKAEMNPIRPRQPLFRRLEHVMTLQFYTPASRLSRVLNPVGKLLSERSRSLTEEGIVHNVHLLRDARNHGYLSFQGSTNWATFIDVNFVIKFYDVEEKPFAPAVDDDRWQAIQPGYFNNCHTGFCDTIKAFVSNEQFPLLAKEVASMKRISVVGHSMGGALASMLALSVYAVKDLKQVTRSLGRLRGRPILRSLWPESAPRDNRAGHEQTEEEDTASSPRKKKRRQRLTIVKSLRRPREIIELVMNIPKRTRHPSLEKKAKTKAHHGEEPVLAQKSDG